MESKKEKLKNCLVEHSKDGNVTVDNHKNRTIYQFDLIVDNSENKWGDIQPKVSAISVENGLIQSYNIRIGEVQEKKRIAEMKDEVLRSRPPSIDKFDTGHSDSVIQPHIRMNDDCCSIDEFVNFMNRLMSRLS